ncbi:MAG: HTH domain-containing protein [Candidatus Nanoarchaeia archaeon]
MAKEKSKIKEIFLTYNKGAFSLFKKPGYSRKDYNFEDLSQLRHLLSNEKARILEVIKSQNPSSIYELAKKLGRNFKAVNDDVKLLKKFGFIDLKEELTKKRKRFRPIIVVDTLDIHFTL